MLADQPITIASNAIPLSSVLSSWKVLGIPFNWKGKLPTTAKQDACSMLRELSQAPLKPQQRVDILRTHLIPRLIHQLTLGVVHKKTLKAIDLAVKSSLRRWLRLPNDVSNAFFHAAINDGGLGIPHL
ncbi:hypothetical protein PHET_00813 [Paragonimus heterotremus]|uniref:Reverse transcriptase n=1 Tax=Paragonimus heterotremus TaxID=100268 RepID=A0A8J4X3E6_9TREM|nr:hypothetical protein PHET_00813 [Paragonimus heterotremus]